MDRNIKTLGRTSAALTTRLAERGQYYFTTRDAARLLNEPVENVSKLLSDLKSRKWVTQIEAGKYLLLSLESGATDLYLGSELTVASKLVSPYYLSFWTAIHRYGHTEQVPRTVFIATTRKKRKIVFSGRVFQFVKLAKHKFFGYGSVWIDADQVQLATPEKLLVDCLDLPQYSGGIKEVSKLLWRTQGSLNWENVVEYCIRIQNGAVVKRLGFLLEVFSIQQVVAERLHALLSAGYALLDPTLPRSGRFSSRWRIQVNVPEDEITSWRFS